MDSVTVQTADAQYTVALDGNGEHHFALRKKWMEDGGLWVTRTRFVPWPHIMWIDFGNSAGSGTSKSP